MIILLCILVLFGFIVGFITGRTSKREIPIGDLRIDESDPEDGPYLFLELKNPPRSFKHLKRVTLNVVAENYISQK